MEKKLRLIVLSAVLLLSSESFRCAHRANLAAELDNVSRFRQEMESVFSDPSFSNAHWGVAIQSLKTGEFFYLRNENKEFMPASNMKLFTTSTALYNLGPEYRFVTRVYTNGLVRPDGVLEGDLIVAGCGDPSLSGRFNGGLITQVFENWADSLMAKGIKTISGRIIGDDDYFGDEHLGNGWSWDYLNDYYAAQISALSLNDNCIDILTLPGDSINAPATIRLEPDTRYVAIVNQVVTGRRTRLSFDRQPGSNQIVCRGTIGIRDRKRRDWVTIENPTLYAVTVLREVLQRRGIVVKGAATDIDDLEGFSYAPLDIYTLCSHTSPTLLEIITVVNKESQNLYAELLFRINGKEMAHEGTAEKAEEAEKEFFGAMGIDPMHLTLADGSGLSRLNLITPMSMVKLLSFMKRHPRGEALYQTLPIAGVDGTLKGRMNRTLADGNVRAKTGMVNKVRALSGYATTKDGEELVFSMIVNFYGGPTGMANQIQDQVCERMVNFTR